MNIINELKEIKAEIKKGKIRKLFLEFLTDESVEFFNQNYGNQHAAYSVIYKKGWYVRPNRDLHHKKTMAYLKATEDGYVIPEKLSDTDYKTAASFYAHNLDDIKLYFDSTNNIIAFNEGKWEAKKGYEYEAESLGELVGIRKRRNYKPIGFPDIAFVDDKEYDNTFDDEDSMFIQELLDYYYENSAYVNENGNYTEDYEQLYNTIFEDDIEEEQDYKIWDAEMYRILFEEGPDEIVEDEKVNKIGTM